ncbi:MULTISPECIES: ATP-binding protein [unclassified Acidovorax]|uniref:ATP-binding protein n=1 Tax=unclassified Acidovorax TaxID=2684926 RepID=UPI0028834A6A|nr:MULTISPECIES: ATP-binding protein [unclassified Acidovorax]
MSLVSPFSRRLYLRIWLAVVGGVAVFALLVGLAWRIAAEHNAQNTALPQGREFVLRDAAGKPVLQGQAQRRPGDRGEGVEFMLDVDNGAAYTLQMSPRQRPLGPDRRDAAFWLRPPFGFLWMLALVGIAVTVGVFPIIRRLLQRLEHLQRGVQRFGEGDLSVRVAERGQDEVADLARQFNAAAARVETLVKSHKSLLANASHELRSPLTRIRMGLELMQGDAPSPSFRAEILRNIAELDQLVDEILLASRLDAREADVGTVEVVDLMGLAAEECVRVDAELQAGAGTAADALEVRGVAKLLRRALRNLLENARRYSQGDITVTLRSVGQRVEVSVCDQGPGVPPEQRERIFEPFYRLPGASERSGGVGLGLALVRSIALRHDGEVKCTARPDGANGACFVLTLPRGG